MVKSRVTLSVETPTEDKTIKSNTSAALGTLAVENEQIVAVTLK